MQSGYYLSCGSLILVSHVLVGQTGTQPSAAAPEQQSVRPAAPAETLSASNQPSERQPRIFQAASGFDSAGRGH